MRFPANVRIRTARVWLIALLAGAAMATVPAAAQAALGIESFFASVCKTATCNAASPTSEFFTQAAGHPNFGITDFTLKSKEVASGIFQPEGVAEGLRVDVPAGLSTNPQAVPMCTMKEFEGIEVEEGVFTEGSCSKETKVGTNEATVLVEVKEGAFIKFPLEGTVYNIEQPNGRPSLFGVALNLAPLVKAPVFAHTLIKGGVEWNTDYHEYFEIEELSKKLPLVHSRLIFEGKITGLKAPYTGEFLTNPSSCNPPGPATTTKLKVESYERQTAEAKYEAPVGASGCAAVPFAPTFSVFPETTQSDQPDGVTDEIALPHGLGLENVDSATLKTATVTLPEGMTLNPSAAHGLEGCTPEQIGIGTTKPVACPAASELGTVAIEVPTLPAKSLAGNIYLGRPATESITKPPYTVYLDAESARYGVSVRLKGSVVPNETTGRLTATFSENPEAPFSSMKLSFKGGPLAPIANPLTCGTARTETDLAPFSGGEVKSPLSSFTVDSNNSGGACPSPLPFALSQTVPATNPMQAGAYSSFTFNLARADGQQYLSQVKTTLPAGLLAVIPSVPLCEEAAANAGTCSAGSEIGTVTVTAGAGPEPYPFTGHVYLTGPYNGAPYGLSIVVPAVIGSPPTPLFNLGNVVTRAGITVGLYSGRAIVTATLPTIVKGIPLRLKTISVTVNRPNYLFNPTNCGPLATESVLTSTLGATQSVSSPFVVSNCGTLPFKPSFAATTGAKTSKANGASLEVKITQGANQANIRQLLFTLPKQLASRLTTLQKACPAATFEAGEPPGGCLSTARVGTVTVKTPVLAGTLSGTAYLVSHGGEAFPDLDLIVKGDGVVVVLVGHTNISSKGITTSKFETLPDVPITSVAVNLPVGPLSLLTANGNVCAKTLTAPTTIIAQSGTKITKNTTITVKNCPVTITGHKTSGAYATVTVRAPAAGRISGGGPDLKFITRRLGKASTATIKVPLSRTGAEVLRKFRRLRLKLRVGFLPKSGHQTSKAYATVTFRS
jgi:hypothetical protein